nr:MAG: erythronate-4-phosphate dehydrogenase [Bacteroidota bacterium]
MRIVADENIPLVREAFAQLGEVYTYPGRQIGPEQVRQADVLLVRSVVRVDRHLLSGSRVRLVGSATVGVDHIDARYLRKAGIAFVHTPEASTQAVAEYVLAAVLKLARLLGRWPERWSVGIIGCGRIGERLARWFSELGLEVLRCDPPRAERGEAGFVPLQEALQAQIVTLHVPLYRGRRHATWHLLNARRMRLLRPDVWLLNTSRGAVIDNRALRRWVMNHPSAQLVLDVWEGEPCIDTALLGRVRLGTPHIAGYSLEARVRATEALYRAVCRYFGRPPSWRADPYLPPAGKIMISARASFWEGLAELVHAVYDPERDDRALRYARHLPEAERGPYFDRLRRDYPLRREFSAYRASVPSELISIARLLGFHEVEEAGR